MNRSRFCAKVLMQENWLLNTIEIELKFGFPLVGDAENLSKNGRISRAKATAASQQIPDNSLLRCATGKNHLFCCCESWSRYPAILRENFCSTKKGTPYKILNLQAHKMKFLPDFITKRWLELLWRTQQAFDAQKMILIRRNYGSNFRSHLLAARFSCPKSRNFFVKFFGP